MKKKVVYTALTKGYDELRQPEFVREDYDYICFSNDVDDMNTGVWQIRKMPYLHAEKVRMCRYVKLHPQELLPDYKYSMWLDCNQRLTEEHFWRMEKCIAENCRLGMVIHPERDCVYQEAYCCTNGLNDTPERIFEHTKFLLDRKFPPRAGLWVTCCIFREHNDPDIAAFDKLWWEVLNALSFRDQMSVTYALKCSNVTPAVLFGRSYWEKYKIEHTGRTKQASFIKRSFRFLFRRAMMFRLALLLRSHGICEYDWRKVELTAAPED